jgi:hypothetical protein
MEVMLQANSQVESDGKKHGICHLNYYRRKYIEVTIDVQHARKSFAASTPLGLRRALALPVTM